MWTPWVPSTYTLSLSLSLTFQNLDVIYTRDLNEKNIFGHLYFVWPLMTKMWRFWLYPLCVWCTQKYRYITSWTGCDWNLDLSSVMSKLASSRHKLLWIQKTLNSNLITWYCRLQVFSSEDKISFGIGNAGRHLGKIGLNKIVTMQWGSCEARRLIKLYWLFFVNGL